MTRTADPTADELIAFARARVGYKAAEEIRVLEVICLDAAGQNDRLVLRKPAADRAPVSMS